MTYILSFPHFANRIRRCPRVPRTSTSSWSTSRGRSIGSLFPPLSSRLCNHWVRAPVIFIWIKTFVIVIYKCYPKLLVRNLVWYWRKNTSAMSEMFAYFYAIFAIIGNKYCNITKLFYEWSYQYLSLCVVLPDFHFFHYLCDLIEACGFSVKI